MSSLTTLLKAKQPLLFLPLVFWLAAASFSSGCGNSDSSSSAQTVAATENDGKAATPPSNGNLNIASLFIEADTFVTLDDGPNFNKLVFQIYHAKDSNNLQAAVVPAMNRNIRFDTSRLQILKWRKDSIDIQSRNMFLGDQQTRGEGNRNEFKLLVDEIEKNNADPANQKITFVIFDPVIDTADSRRFLYKMYGVTNTNIKDVGLMTLTTATRTYATNPSPPAKPD